MAQRDTILLIRACRICLGSQYIDAVTLDYESGWLQLFELCFGISLSPEDIPRSLCQECANNVKKYSQFKELFHKSDILWKSLTNVKCYAQKIESNELVKNEVFNEEYKIENDSVNESNNYEYLEELCNDFDNLTDDNDEFMIKVKNEGVRSETPTNKVSINEIISDEKVTSLVTENEGVTQNLKNDLKFLEQNRVKVSFKCKRCKKTYGKEKWYWKHVKSCKLNKIKKQRSTSVNINQNPGMEMNLKDKHQTKMKKEPEANICGICTFSSYNIDNMIEHLEGHWTNNDLQCMICEFIAKDQAAMSAHRYNHYAGTTPEFLCHICKKKARSQLSLQFHYRKIHLNKSGALCSQLQCDKVYNSFRLWKRHVILHNHPGYICDLCGVKYKYKHLMVEHLSTHGNPKPHVCDTCGKTFGRLRNLKLHIANIHVKSEPIKCSHCDRMFKNNTCLRTHLNVIAMKKIWKCEFCPMEYSMQWALKSHLRSHSEDRPHCCHICGSRYKAKGQLVIHMRNHTGDRPFQCTLCGKAFKTSQLLKRHTTIHTGIQPYKCLHCEKTFGSKKRMMKHCTKWHKTQLTIIND